MSDYPEDAKAAAAESSEKAAAAATTAAAADVTTAVAEEALDAGAGATVTVTATATAAAGATPAAPGTDHPNDGTPPPPPEAGRGQDDRKRPAQNQDPTSTLAATSQQQRPTNDPTTNNPDDTTTTTGGLTPKQIKRQRTTGYISPRDASVTSLPPVTKCPMKNCKLSCHSRVINDVPYQSRLRSAYVTMVRDAPTSGHAVGTAWLATMLSPMDVEPRKTVYWNKKKVEGATTSCIWCQRCPEHATTQPRHQFKAGSCPNFADAMKFCDGHVSRKNDYRVPWIAPEGGNTLSDGGGVTTVLDDGTVSESVPVHMDVYRTIFGISKQRLEKIKKIAKSDETNPVQHDRRSQNGGHNRLSQDQVDGLLKMLGNEPCITNPTDPKSYRFSSDLSLAYFWKKYLASTGKDDAFLAQAERYNFYPTYDRKILKRAPEAADYEKDAEGKALSPSVSYRAAIRIFAEYDVKFDVPPGEVGKGAGGGGGGGGVATRGRRRVPPRGVGAAKGNAAAAAAAAGGGDGDPDHPPPFPSNLQTYEPGMIKECKCSNLTCPGSRLDFVVVNRGFTPAGEEFGFDWSKELVSKNDCPGCGCPCTQVRQIAFNNCRFKYEWKELGTDRVFEKKWKKLGDNQYFVPEQGVKYQYITFFVS